ncbi:MAG: hypothetical protein ACREDR_04410 [Blastocatellia bacterium]
MASQNVESLRHAYLNCPLTEYLSVTRAIAERDGLSAEEKESISARLGAVHALTILRHIQLIREGVY